MSIEPASNSNLKTINIFLRNMDMQSLDEKSLNFSCRKVYMIKKSNKIMAFICYLVLKNEIELEALYVEKEYRKQGYATKLIEYMINEAWTSNCDSIFLEVRKENLNAINLYRKNNFKIIGYRKGYYGDEDGLVMKNELR